MSDQLRENDPSNRYLDVYKRNKQKYIHIAETVKFTLNSDY